MTAELLVFNTAKVQLLQILAAELTIMGLSDYFQSTSSVVTRILSQWRAWRVYTRNQGKKSLKFLHNYNKLENWTDSVYNSDCKSVAATGKCEVFTTSQPLTTGDIYRVAQKTGPAFNIQYCKSSPTCTQVGRGVFKIFAMKHTGPVFLGHPVYVNRISAKLAYIHITQSPDDTCPSVP